MEKIIKKEKMSKKSYENYKKKDEFILYFEN